MDSLKDLFRGCILGTAIGDALGMPTEGLKLDEIKRIYGYVDDFYPSPDLKAGEWTDDTEQMILLAESIIDRVYFDPDDFADKLRNWAERAFRIRTGPTTRQALRNLIAGMQWDKAGVDSATCGASMRVAPVGLVYHFSINLVEKYAVISSSITHKNSSAIGGAVAVAVAVACILSDFNEDEMLEEVLKRTRTFDPLLADKIEYSMEIRDEGLDYAVEKLGNSIMTWDVVPMSFYCYFSSKDFYSSVTKGANAGGDTDSISAIAGALSGAKYGFKAIPEKWVGAVKDSSYLLNIADMLYDTHVNIVKITT
ncbi:ADP-ribosylglycohydrolase [Archaeoglobus sulfaticallidus PM70-1]|uniref:ADP-ribosylglycohydrolase n=1 Tax=Archaeoglobus sulfaticallidus PM70-1 TaxID=387631 RepID=N0BB97_9EURY|nr:ADP-ribosylglycohydrolase family protein [Archaeoglobus sulfaticallidus]AGK60879.1 ADP-ribosylglycohydrolase [Archaeoglobus sulfaticallidus PM70-1]